MRNKELKIIKIRGITLIELLVALSIFVIVSAVAVVYLNPVGQFSKARNSQRELHLQGLMVAIRDNIAEGKGTFTCAAGAIPTSTKRMAIDAVNYDIASCIVPTYLTTLPFDPSTSSARYVSNTDYDTGYFILRNASSGAITLSAPAAELGKIISITR